MKHEAIVICFFVQYIQLLTYIKIWPNYHITNKNKNNVGGIPKTPMLKCLPPFFIYFFFIPPQKKKTPVRYTLCPRFLMQLKIGKKKRQENVHMLVVRMLKSRTGRFWHAEKWGGGGGRKENGIQNKTPTLCNKNRKKPNAEWKTPRNSNRFFQTKKK